MAVNWTGGRKHLPNKKRNQFGQLAALQQNYGPNTSRQSHSSVQECQGILTTKLSVLKEKEAKPLKQQTVNRLDIYSRRHRILSCPSWTAIDAKCSTSRKASESSSSSSNSLKSSEEIQAVSRDQFDAASRQSFQRPSTTPLNQTSPSTGLDVVIGASASLLPAHIDTEAPVTAIEHPLRDQEEDTKTSQARGAVEDVMATRRWLYNSLFPSF